MAPLPLSTGETLILLTLLSLFLFLIGAQLVLVFGAWALGFTLIHPILPPVNLSIASYEQLNSFPFVAVPIFIIVGNYLNEFGISRNIIDFSRSIGGWLPGSSGNTAVYTAGVFSAITGSNAATTAAIGEGMLDELEEEGYDRRFAAATIASGGTLGIIIPPSVLFILYGIRFNVSVPDLFIAGLIPGIFMMLGLSGVCSYIAYTRDYGTVEYKFSVREVIRTSWRAKGALGAIVLLLGGIWSGLFTPSEAGAAALGYILLIGLTSGMFTYGRVYRPIRSTVNFTGVIMPIFITSAGIQQALSILGLQTIIAEWILTLQVPLLMIFAMVIVMLISGSILGSVPNMILTAPLLAPVAFELGLDPIMWAVVFMISDSIGFITPPYGINLFVISSVGELDYIEVAYRALPYLLVLIAVWLVFFLFPGLNILAPGARVSVTT